MGHLESPWRVPDRLTSHRPLPYRAVLFDFFGTLTCAVRRGVGHAAVARLLGCDPADMVVALDRTFAARATGRYGTPVESLRRIAYQLGARPSEARLAAAAELRIRVLRAETRLRAEAVPALRAVRARGLGTGLISDCTQELPRYLPELAIAPLLDTCVYSVEAGARKPSPVLYLLACHRLGVRPRECLFVGDGGGRELTGAAALGMTALQLTAPDLGCHLQFDPDTGWAGPTIDTLDQVRQVVDWIGTARSDLARTG